MFIKKYTIYTLCSSYDAFSFSQIYNLYGSKEEDFRKLHHFLQVFLLPKCRALRVGVMHFINHIYISLQLQILHTEFRRENPREEAENAQMLTHDKGGLIMFASFYSSYQMNQK